MEQINKKKLLLTTTRGNTYLFSQRTPQFLLAHPVLAYLLMKNVLGAWKWSKVVKKVDLFCFPVIAIILPPAIVLFSIRYYIVYGHEQSIGGREKNVNDQWSMGATGKMAKNWAVLSFSHRIGTFFQKTIFFRNYARMRLSRKCVQECVILSV